MESKQPFTGRARRLKNRWSVKFADTLAKVVITVGGIGTIVAVTTVFFYLLWVVAPLFSSARAGAPRAITLPAEFRQPAAWGVDEYRVLAWLLGPDGELATLRLDTGALLQRRQAVEHEEITAAQVDPDGRLALGTKSGQVLLGWARFETSFVDVDELPPELRDQPTGYRAEIDGAIAERIPSGQYRRQRFVLELDKPVAAASAPIEAIDLLAEDERETLAAVVAGAEVKVVRYAHEENLLTGAVKTTSQTFPVPLPKHGSNGPAFVVWSSRGSHLNVAWQDGRLLRLATGNLAAPEIELQTDLLDAGELTALVPLPGRATLLAGDSLGGVRAWFAVRTGPGGEGPRQMVMAHDLTGPESPVTGISTPPDKRLAAIAYRNGALRTVFVTTERSLTASQIPGQLPIERALVAPKTDGLAALAGERLWVLDYDPAYPEASFAALFRPVWYEDYDRPQHMWQSSAGSDVAEPKFGLVPLIFGTLKATLYSMLFGVPVALLGAIYSSEFIAAGRRAQIKSLVEMMASLPSVVLGFLAGLVFAPFVEQVAPAVVAGLLIIPWTIFASAHVWQLLPQRVTILFERYRLLYVAAALGLGIVGGAVAGPVLESLLFAGDFRAWLNRQAGSAIGGWTVLLLPLAGVAVFLGLNLYANPWLRDRYGRLARTQFAALNLVKFLAGSLAALLLAALAGGLLTLLGLDPRGSIVDTYDQRNALVVGFVMGFAIIPLIYTISEDALSTVPQHLRSASLGAGATPWQTAIRVVIPTAMSGLFSAVMIGLGRAIGETMIVLMGVGNTPIMELNVFNGFRTLSANIAEELPEAAHGSTHFRTLFLAALTLFLMTFALNTAAELIRIRFRRRAYQL